MADSGHYIARRPPDFLSKQENYSWKGEPRWRDSSGERIYTYDRMHGHVEAYNKRGRHVGVLDIVTGELIAPAVKGRSIDV